MAIALVIAGVVAKLYFSRSKSALQRYEAELRAKGEKLTFTELVVPHSNDPGEEESRRIFSPEHQFNMPEMVPKLMEYTAAGAARGAWQGEFHLDLVVAGGTVLNPPPMAEWSVLDRLTGSLRPNLDEFRKGLEHPAPNTGWKYYDTPPGGVAANSILPPYSGQRDRAVVYGFVSEVIASLHSGQIDAAINGIHMLAEMARLNRDEPCAQCQAFRPFIANIGLGVVWEVLQAPGLDEQQLSKIQRDWEKLALLDVTERALLGERAQGMYVFEQVRLAKADEMGKLLAGWTIPRPGHFWQDQVWEHQVAPTLYRASSIDRDEELFLRHSTATIDNFRGLKAGRAWREVQDEEAELSAQLNKTVSNDSDIFPHIARYRVSELMIVNTSHLMGNSVRAETLRRMTVTAIGIRRYGLKNGHVPASLAALVPEFAASAPIDLMSGKPLCYRVNEDGTFLLYSVGEDGKDDGGDATPTAGSPPGLWTGKDAVWPVVKRTGK